MSEKQSKGYDPTQARMVGNILAGNPTYQNALAQGKFDLMEALEQNARYSTKRIIKALKKDFEG